jgi:L-gulonolactone oxidase
VYGWAYDVLIGGLYPGQRPEWDYEYVSTFTAASCSHHRSSLHGKTLELAVPVTQANALLKRVRELFDQAAAEGKPVTSTYRSGINIKFGKAFDSFLSQTNERVSNKTADWSKVEPCRDDFNCVLKAFMSGSINVRFSELQAHSWRSSPLQRGILYVHVSRISSVRYSYEPMLDLNLATTLVNEFPARPHWTKNTREVFTKAVKNLEPDVGLPYF